MPYIFFQKLFGMQKILFKRCMQPEGTIDDPTLAIFMTVCKKILEHMPMQNGDCPMENVKATLWIAPVKRTYVVRLEANWTVLAIQLPKLYH